MILICKRCKNEWNYKGSNEYWATCTKCLNKVKVGDLPKTKETHNENNTKDQRVE